MKENKTREYAKDWSISTIIGKAFSDGMEFMARDNLTNKDTNESKQILVDEIESRLEKNREYEQALKDERLLLEATMGKIKEYEKALQRIDKKVHSIYAVGLPKIESKLWEIKKIIEEELEDDNLK